MAGLEDRRYLTIAEARKGAPKVRAGPTGNTPARSFRAAWVRQASGCNAIWP